MSPFARSRHRVEAPRALPGRRVIGIEEPSNPELAPADPHDHVALHGQRRPRDAVSRLRIPDRHIPHDGAGTPVEGHQVSVQRSDVHPVTQERDAAARPVATQRQRPWKLPAVRPQDVSGVRVERQDFIRRLGHVHHAVGDERRRLDHLVRGGWHRAGPAELKLLHIGTVHLA